MSYGIINFYSGDADAAFEISHLGFMRNCATTHHELYLKINLTFAFAKSYHSQSIAQYIQTCAEMIAYCNDQLTGSHKSKTFTMKQLAFLRVKVRVEEIKRRLEQGDKDVLRSYQLHDLNYGYADLKLFREAQACVQEKLYKETVDRILKLLVDFKAEAIEASLLNWVMQHSHPADPVWINILSKLVENLPNMGDALLFTDGIFAFLKELPSEYDKPLEELIFQEDILKKLNRGKNSYSKQNLLFIFVNILVARNPNLGSRLLENINCLDFLVKADPAEFVMVTRKLAPDDFFKRALQRGFDYQPCHDLMRQNFSEYRKEITYALYEALSKGEFVTAKNLMELTNTHEQVQRKIKETSVSHTDTALASVKKATIRTHQQVSRYKDGIAFSLPDFWQYLEEKYALQSQKVSEHSGTFFSSSKQSSLYFINRPMDFIANLTKLEFIPEDAVEEFKTNFFATFVEQKSTPAVAEKNNSIEPSILALISALQKQNQEIMAMYQSSSQVINNLESQVKELKAEQTELKKRIETLEGSQPSCSINLS